MAPHDDFDFPVSRRGGCNAVQPFDGMLLEGGACPHSRNLRGVTIISSGPCNGHQAARSDSMHLTE